MNLVSIEDPCLIISACGSTFWIFSGTYCLDCTFSTYYICLCISFFPLCPVCVFVCRTCTCLIFPSSRCILLFCLFAIFCQPYILVSSFKYISCLLFSLFIHFYVVVMGFEKWNHSRKCGELWGILNSNILLMIIMRLAENRVNTNVIVVCIPNNNGKFKIA